MTNTIIVDEVDRNRVQKADVEATSLMNLISFMIKHDVDISNERFLQYEKKYQEAFFAFELAKTEIEKKYLSGLNVKSWNLSYADCELTYEE